MMRSDYTDCIGLRVGQNQVASDQRSQRAVSPEQRNPDRPPSARTNQLAASDRITATQMSSAANVESDGSWLKEPPLSTWRSAGEGGRELQLE